MKANNFAALIYLKNQVKKWRNIAIIAFLAVIYLIFSNHNPSKSDIDIAGDYIANIKIEGMIDENDYGSQVLEKIADQKNIKALLVNIDSPGGTIVGSEILYKNLRNISEKKPVIAIMNGMATSGGYMVASASDYIIAHNGTLTGSIGVIMESGELTGLAEKLGIKFQTYKSSPLKGTPSPFEKATPKVDRAINESIEDSYQFFVDLIIERRKGKLKLDQIDKIVDGRVFTGRQALKLGLVDEIGDKKEALKYLHDVRKINISNVQDISITKENSSLLEKIIGNNPMSGMIPGNKGLMAIFGR